MISEVGRTMQEISARKISRQRRQTPTRGSIAVAVNAHISLDVRRADETDLATVKMSLSAISSDKARMR